jgi:putative tributyrin esterase
VKELGDLFDPQLDRENGKTIANALSGLRIMNFPSLSGFGTDGWRHPSQGSRVTAGPGYSRVGQHVAAARLIALDILPPVVIAMPSDGLWGDGSGYVAHNECDYERWIMEEVRAAAIEACASCDQNSSLLLAGLSMGGFAALRLAGKYPERVRAAAAHSAVTEAYELDPLIEENRSGWSTSPEDVSVIAALRAAGDRLPPIRFDCGREDPFLQSNRLLHDMLESNGIAHIYAEADGGHNWSYWQREIDQTFRFFGALLKEKTLHNVR